MGGHEVNENLEIGLVTHKTKTQEAEDEVQSVWQWLAALEERCNKLGEGHMRKQQRRHKGGCGKR